MEIGEHRMNEGLENVFWILVMFILFLSVMFLYFVFIKTDSCALMPLEYWTEHFSEDNGDFGCSCVTEKTGVGFSFSSQDPALRITNYYRANNHLPLDKAAHEALLSIK